MQVYRLLIARDGPKLKRVEEGSQVVIGGRALAPGHAVVQAVTAAELHLAGSRATMEQLAGALSTVLRQLVVDETGLSGTFDFDVKFQREDDSENKSGNPFIGSAIQKTLGLRVEAGKTPVEVLLIDHLGKLSEN
jgi:uncharacterized protein (TIGR03435 family)